MEGSRIEGSELAGSLASAQVPPPPARSASAALRENDRLATGRPETVDPEGGESGTEGGQSIRIDVFRTIALTSSRTKTPPKLFE